MISPELDEYIKKVTQVQHPKYFRKYRANSVLSGAGDQVCTFPVNQNENVQLILITDIIINCGATIQTFANVTEASYAENGGVLFEALISPFTSQYYNNIYHLVESDNFTMSVLGISKCRMSVGYIKISAET